jgi:hypothetical protein
MGIKYTNFIILLLVVVELIKGLYKQNNSYRKVCGGYTKFSLGPMRYKIGACACTLAFHSYRPLN